MNVVLEELLKAVLLVFGHPFSFKVDLARLFALELDFKPLVNAISVH